MMAGSLLIETQYFPPISYFAEILEHDTIVIEAWENYQKQSYRNRCAILSANKINILSIPVIKPHQNVLIREVKIDYSQKWLNVHWRGIASAYGKAPFFEHYGDFFREILYKRNDFLFDLNMELLTLCLKLLGIKRTIKLSEGFNISGGLSNVNDKRNVIHPKGSRISTSVNYRQVFGKDFVPDLSILDLLFCEGNNSLHVLKMGKKN
jgi:hypothetical protein